MPTPPGDGQETPPSSRLAPAVVLVVVFFAFLGVVFYFAAQPYDIVGNKARLEEKQLEDVAKGIRGIDDAEVARLSAPEVGARGRDAWSVLIGRKILHDTLLSKLVSLNSPVDAKADKQWIDEGGQLPPNSCSYTAPAVSEIKRLLQRAGEERCVVICLNSSNWNNYPDHGTLVLWSDKNRGEYLTFEVAQEQYGITAEEWDDPAGKLFGKKAPFQFTYE